MILQAVIIIPSLGDQLPSYLFEPVAGVPLLLRQILGLKRAGIADIILLIGSAGQPTNLVRELEQHQHLVSNATIIPGWSAYHQTAALNREDAYFLILPIDTLPSRQVYSKVLNQLPPAGALTLGIRADAKPQSSPQASSQKNPAVQNQPTIFPHNPALTTINDTGTAHICLFSNAAWQDWLDWPKLPEAEPFSEFVAQKAASAQVVAVNLEPAEIISLARDRDRARATHWLIAMENISPLTEGILEKSWNRPLARFLLPWILDRPITPNQITIFSFLLGLLAVWGFAHGSYAASVGAGLLLPIVLVLDCLDGSVARLKFQETRLGALLDIHGDTVLNLLLFLGIALGCYRTSGQPIFLGLAILITMGYLTCWRRLRPAPQNPATVGPQVTVGKPVKAKILDEAVSRDFFYLILLVAIFRQLDWFVVALAVGTNIFAWLVLQRQPHGQN